MDRAEDTPASTIAEVTAWVAGGPGRAAAALEAERGRPEGPRTTLIADLERAAAAGTAKPSGRQVRQEVYVTDPENQQIYFYGPGDVPESRHRKLIGDHVYRGPAEQQ
jgi:hypothetical protein